MTTMPPPPPQPPYGPPPMWYGPPPQPPQRGMSKGAKIALSIVGGVFGLALLGALLPDNDTDTDTGTGTDTGNSRSDVDEVAQDWWDSSSYDDQTSMCYVWDTDRAGAVDIINENATTPYVQDAMVDLLDQEC